MQGRFKEALPSLRHAPSTSTPRERALPQSTAAWPRWSSASSRRPRRTSTAAERSPNADDRLSAAINRGRLTQRQGDFAAAEEAFSIALSRDPKSFAALIGRGMARENPRATSRAAAEDYLAAIKLDPKNAEANLRLGLCLVTLKKTGLGRRYLRARRSSSIRPARPARRRGCCWSSSKTP